MERTSFSLERNGERMTEDERGDKERTGKVSHLIRGAVTCRSCSVTAVKPIDNNGGRHTLTAVTFSRGRRSRPLLTKPISRSVRHLRSSIVTSMRRILSWLSPSID